MASGDMQGRFGSREFSTRILVPEIGRVQGKAEPRPGRFRTNVSLSPMGIGLASRGG